MARLISEEPLRAAAAASPDDDADEDDGDQDDVDDDDRKNDAEVGFIGCMQMHHPVLDLI